VLIELIHFGEEHANGSGVVSTRGWTDDKLESPRTIEAAEFHDMPSRSSFSTKETVRRSSSGVAHYTNTNLDGGSTSRATTHSGRVPSRGVA
jgi:hypothetical protein